MGKISDEELQKIKEMIEAEYPGDPALQQVHIARKILSKEAELEGLSFLEYIKLLSKEERVQIADGA